MDRVLCLIIYMIAFFARFSKRLARLGIGRYEEWKPGRKLKILLVGYNGARNIGSKGSLQTLYQRDRPGRRCFFEKEGLFPRADRHGKVR